MTVASLLNQLKLTIVLLTFTTVNTYAQVLELFQGFDFSNVQPGDSFAIEIINTDNDAITFYPLTVFDSSGNYLFLDEQQYDTYLHTLGNQVDALKAHARIVKSPFFKNGSLNGRIPLNEFSGGVYNQQIADKKYAFPQWFLTSCNYQCGEYWTMGANVLKQFGVFEDDSIWEISIPDVHTLGEGIINGDTMLVDFDPSMPRFLDTLPDGSFINATDIYLHPEYLDLQNQHFICDENDSCRSSEVTTEYYKSFFSDSSSLNRFTNNNIVPQNMPGTWTLCAGCSMIFEYKLPLNIVDLNDSTKRMLMDSVIYYMIHNITDTLLLGSVLQQLLSVASKQEAWEAFNKFDFLFAHELSNPLLSNSFGRNALTCKLKMPANAQGYSFSNIQMPLAIRDIVSDSGLVVNGNNIAAGQHNFKLWDEGGILDNNADFTVPDSAYNYVKNISVLPFNNVEITLYYNQILYGFFKGFKAEFFSVSPSFTVNTYPQLITANKATSAHNNRNDVYPNPVNNVLHVSEKGILIDALGNKMMQLEKGVNNIGALDPGVYFFRSEDEILKIVKY